MIPTVILSRFLRLFCLVLLLSAGSVSFAETPVGSVVESRVLVGLQAGPETVAPMMPEGWTAIPFPSGPLKGATAMMGFLDGHAVYDPEGKPTGTRLTAALIALGKSEADVRMFVLRVYTDDPDANPYGNTRPATIRRDRTLEAQSGVPRRHSESWTVTSEAGGEIVFSLSYTGGTPAHSTGSSKSYSAEDTAVVVTQSFEQIADLALSTALGKPLDGEVALDSTGTELDGLIGPADITAVVNIPVYIRQVFLP